LNSRSKGTELHFFVKKFGEKMKLSYLCSR